MRSSLTWLMTSPGEGTFYFRASYALQSEDDMFWFVKDDELVRNLQPPES